MGKRKERRLAAMMTSSRRTKLDLFADPSGEMVGSPLDEGGDFDQGRQAGGPTSPSSSGGKQENPLLLLGQYSDDELDEETRKQTVEVEGAPQVELDDKVKHDVADDALGSKTAVDSDTADTKSRQQLATAKSPNAEDVEENAAVVAKYIDTDVTVQNGVDAPSMQIVGDLPGGWRVVMHEQSNQYYYWNTSTGETSWAVPEGLTSEGGIATGADICSTSEVKMECPAVFQAHLDPERAAYPNLSGTNGHVTSDVVPGSVEAYGAMENSNGLLMHTLSSNEAKLDEQSSNYGATDFQFSQLIVYGQNLLERSKTLKGSVNSPEGIEFILKEIEIRLYDCQTLLSYGSSLLPFWWHTENQLKRLESVIGVAEASSVEQKASLIKESVEERPKAVETSASLSGDNNSSLANETSVKTEAGNENPEIEDLNAKDLSSGSISKDVETTDFTDTVIKLEQDTTAANSVSKVEDTGVVNSISNVEAHVEDVDMDVEMEIDDVVVASDSRTQLNISAHSLEQIIYTHASPIECLSVSVEPNVPPPPPPDEEWIPPPPPDGEPIPPPPPPEDPPMSEPFPYADSVALTYQESYGSGYVLPTYSYYAPAVAEVTSSTYYMQNNGSYTGDAQQQPYYEAVAANTLHEVAAGANTAGPISFYDTSVAVATNGATATTIEPSEYYIASGPVNYAVTAAGKEPNSVHNNVEAENNKVPVLKHSGPSGVVSSGHVHAYNSSEEESGTTKGDAMAALTAASKSQNKVPRSKKRAIAVAPTLRSNKKVSSLLDKWMAAKEELHEEDEEPADAYELLEKKRQKEIEEWHASQIASRQALENANFQPLGGDWRERVKRRRAETAKSQSSKLVESVENEKMQPDLTELSRNLPPGWQAYWDESSKEVYYANSITSDTTWTRPTR